jgi:hypothetical protein
MPRWRAPVGRNSDSAAHAFARPPVAAAFPALRGRARSGSADRFNGVVPACRRGTTAASNRAIIIIPLPSKSFLSRFIS